MKLQAEVRNEKLDVELKRDGERVTARVADREYQLEASEVEPNLWLFKHGHNVYEVYVAPNGIVNVGNNVFEVRLVDPKRVRGAGGSDAGADGVAEIRTAMPGRLVRILVDAGTEVKHGEGIVVVEAMKMQNELKSPKDGVVREIRFAEGVNVNAGDVLAVIE